MAKAQVRVQSIGKSGRDHGWASIGCIDHLVQQLTMPIRRRWHLAIDALGDPLEDRLGALVERLQNRAERCELSNMDHLRLAPEELRQAWIEIQID